MKLHIMIWLFSLCAATQLYGMEARMSMDEHKTVLAYARAAYDSYSQAVPGKSKSMQLIEIFKQCETQFPAYAATAKMYVYFQLRPNERTLHDSFLVNLDPKEFIFRCPDFSFTGIGAELNILKTGLPYVSPELVEYTFRSLLLANHVSFIAYLSRFIVYLPSPESMPLDYEDFYHSFKKVVLTGSRFVIDALLTWYKLDANYVWSDGITPLHIATIRGDPLVIQILLSHHADPTFAQERDIMQPYLAKDVGEVVTQPLDGTVPTVPVLKSPDTESALLLAQRIARQKLSDREPIANCDVEYLEQPAETIRQQEKIIALFNAEIARKA